MAKKKWFIGDLWKGKKMPEHIRKKVVKTLAHQKGIEHPSWKGGRVLACGYYKVKHYTHPYRDSQNYVKEHRLIMERYLGRILTRKEQVHHINGIKTDNRLENLVLISNSTHIRNHRKEEVKNGTFKKIRPDFGQKPRQ